MLFFKMTMLKMPGKTDRMFTNCHQFMPSYSLKAFAFVPLEKPFLFFKLLFNHEIRGIMCNSYIYFLYLYPLPLPPKAACCNG